VLLQSRPLRAALGDWLDLLPGAWSVPSSTLSGVDWTLHGYVSQQILAKHRVVSGTDELAQRVGKVAGDLKEIRRLSALLIVRGSSALRTSLGRIAKAG